MMPGQTQGIQQLLAAEKRAAEKVAEARKRKARRLKQAKEEAQEEIKQYQKQMESRYQEHEQKIMGSKGDVETKIDQATQMKMKQIDMSVANNKEQAISQLLCLVFDIKPEVHQNLKL